MKIGIVDYGMGNINSIIGALNYLGYDNVIYSYEQERLNDCDKLILPGVGAFDKAMLEIQNRNLNKILTNLTIEKTKPILGICLGMQLLSNLSNENKITEGLKFVNSEVTKFKDLSIKIPHIGFNQVKTPKKSILFKEIEDNSDFYFCHSYYLKTNYNINQSYCNYGNDFISSFEYKNFAGVQFHPELSQSSGLKLLQNFLFFFDA